MSQENPNIDHKIATDDSSIEEAFLSKIETWLSGGGDVNSPFSTNGDTALHVATQNGYVRVINALILEGANVEILDANGSTALHIAAKKGYTDIIEALITAGTANVEIQDGNGHTALRLAAQNGHADAIRSLILGTANAEACGAEARTALHLAAQNGHADALNALITIGCAKVETQDANGFTALHIASEKGYTDIIDALITVGRAKVNVCSTKGNSTALHLAAKSRNAEAIKALIIKGAAIEAKNANGYTALHIAAENGDPEVLMQLILARADVCATTKNREIPLHIAAANGHTDAIKILISTRHVNVNAQDANQCTALHLAAMYGHISAIEILRNAEANSETPDANGSTALHLAAERRKAEAIKVLIIKGAHVEERNKQGFTALHIAAEHGDADTINALIQAGANVKVRTKQGFTALHIAAEHGNADAINLLIYAGANIRASNNQGITALHMAAEYGNTDTINALIHAIGVDIKECDKQGFTALHHAVLNKDLGPLIQLIIVGKARVNVATESGITALHTAAEKGNAAAIEVLIDAGEKVNAVSIDKQTALYIAAVHGNIEAVKALIDGHADVNVPSASNHTALHAAAEYEHISVMQLLIANRASITAVVKGYTALHLAASRGHVDFAIKEWKARGSDITDNLYQALHRAAQIERKDSITLLLEELNKLNLTAKSIFLLSVSPSFLLKMSAHDFLESISEILKKKKTIDFSQYNKQLVSFIEDQIKSIMAPSKTTSHAERRANCTEDLEEILHILVNPNIKLPDNAIITPNILRGHDFEEDIKILQILAKYEAHFRCELNNMAIATWCKYSATKDTIKEGRIFDTFKLFKFNEVDWREVFTKIVNENDDWVQESKYYLPLFKARLENAQFINMCKKYIISALDIQPVLEAIGSCSSVEEMKDKEGNTIWHWFAEKIPCNLTKFVQLNIDLNATNNAGETVFARMIKCQNALKIANIIDSNWDLIVRQNVDVNQHTTDGECVLTKLAKDLKSVSKIREFIIKCKPSGEFFFNINQIDTSEGTTTAPKRVIDYIAHYWKHDTRGINIDFINDLRKSGSLEPQILIEGLRIADFRKSSIHSNNNDSNAYNIMNMLYARYPLSPQEIDKAINCFQQKQSNIPFAKRVDKCVDTLLKWHSINPPHAQNTIIRILQQSGIDLTQAKETLAQVIIAKCRGINDNIRQFLQEMIFVLSITESNILGNPLEIYSKFLHGNIAWAKHDSAVSTVGMVVNALIGEYKGHGYTMGPNTKVPLFHSATKTNQIVIVDFKKLVGTMIHVINQTPDLMVNNLYIEGTQVRLEDMFIYCLSDLEHCFSGQLVNLMSVIQPVLLAEEEGYLDNTFTTKFIQCTSKLLDSMVHRFPDISQKAILAWIYDMSTDSIQPQEWCGFTQAIHGALNALIISQNIAQGDKSCPFKGVHRRMLKFTKDIIQSYRNNDILENSKDITQSYSDRDSIEDKMYTIFVSMGVDIMREGISCVATEWCTSTVRAVLDGKSIEVPNIYCASLAFGEFATVGIDVFLHAIGKLPKNKVAEFLVLLIDNFILSADVEKELIRLEKIFKQQYNSSIVQDVSGEENLEHRAEVENVQEDVEATGADTHTESAI